MPGARPPPPALGDRAAPRRAVHARRCSASWTGCARGARAAGARPVEPVLEAIAGGDPRQLALSPGQRPAARGRQHGARAAPHAARRGRRGRARRARLRLRARPARSCARDAEAAIDVATELAGVGRVPHGPGRARARARRPRRRPPPNRLRARRRCDRRCAPDAAARGQPRQPGVGHRARARRRVPGAARRRVAGRRARRADRRRRPQRRRQDHAARHPHRRRARPTAGRVSRVGGLRLAHLAQGDALPAGRHASATSCWPTGTAPPTTSGPPTPRSATCSTGWASATSTAPSTGCPAARSAGSRWPRRWSATPTSSSSTSRPTTSTSRASAGSPGTCWPGGARVVVVTHDRWFLDAVCTRTWEVAGGRVESYLGGYADWVYARAERARQSDAAEARRQNLARKELAWLRRGPPARTSKPRFRIEAAEALIADVPPPRNTVELLGFATNRLGRTVLELEDATATDRPGAPCSTDVTWRLGPGRPDRHRRRQRLGQDHAAAHAHRGAPAATAGGWSGARTVQLARAQPGAGRPARRTCGCWRPPSRWRSTSGSASWS